jgi:hypothetical protein
MKTEKLPANRKGKYNCTVDRNFFVDTRQL